MIYVNEKKATLCKGDFRPAQFYKGKKKIAGYEIESFEGEGSVTLENCYNDRLYSAKIYGNENGVGDVVSEGENAGKHRIGVIARGKNIYKPTRISAVGISASSSVASLSNNYGTTISTTDATKGEFTVTQTQAPDSYPTGYQNGYFVIETGESGLVEGKTYTLSFDCEVLGSLIGKDNMSIIINGGTNSVLFYSANGRVRVDFVYSTYNSRDNYIEFRNAGQSLKISNLMITDAGNSTNYEPYKEAQAFNIFLDSPLQNGEYIDFENGKVVRKDYEEEMELPILPTTRGTTVYEINTNISARISGEYRKVIKWQT